MYPNTLGGLSPELWQMIFQGGQANPAANGNGFRLPPMTGGMGPASPAFPGMRMPPMTGGMGPTSPFFPGMSPFMGQPQAAPAPQPQLAPQNTGAPSGYAGPAQGPQISGWGTVGGLLAQLLPRAMSGPVAGAATALTATPADTGEDPMLAARVAAARDRGYDPLSSISVQSQALGAAGAAQKAAEAAAPVEYGGPDEAKRGAMPRGGKAPAPAPKAKKTVPLPPERPAGLLSQQDPDFLQRLISGQWSGPIQNDMVLPGDRTSSRR